MKSRANIVDCPRCGEEHDKTFFRKLSNPVDKWTHWAMCPNTSEPLLGYFKAGDWPYCIVDENQERRRLLKEEFEKDPNVLGRFATGNVGSIQNSTLSVPE